MKGVKNWPHVFASYLGLVNSKSTLFKFRNNQVIKIRNPQEKRDTSGIATVFDDSLDYTITGNVAIATNAQKTSILGDLNVMQEANDFFEQLDLLGNGGLQSTVRTLSEDGIFNAKDRQYQFDDKVLHFSKRIPNASGEFANMYAINKGSVGVLVRLERDAIKRTKTATHEWDEDTMPLTGMPIGTYYYYTVEDASATAGAATADLTRTVVDHFGFSNDVAFVVAHNSDNTTLAGPIMAATIQDAVSS